MNFKLHHFVLFVKNYLYFIENTNFENILIKITIINFVNISLYQHVNAKKHYVGQCNIDWSLSIEKLLNLHICEIIVTQCIQKNSIQLLKLLYYPLKFLSKTKLHCRLTRLTLKHCDLHIHITSIFVLSDECCYAR